MLGSLVIKLLSFSIKFSSSCKAGNTPVFHLLDISQCFKGRTEFTDIKPHECDGCSFLYYHIKKKMLIVSATEFIYSAREFLPFKKAIWIKEVTEIDTLLDPPPQNQASHCLLRYIEVHNVKKFSTKQHDSGEDEQQDDHTQFIKLYQTMILGIITGQNLLDIQWPRAQLLMSYSVTNDWFRILYLVQWPW